MFSAINLLDWLISRFLANGVTTFYQYMSDVFCPFEFMSVVVYAALLCTDECLSGKTDTLRMVASFATRPVRCVLWPSCYTATTTPMLSQLWLLLHAGLCCLRPSLRRDIHWCSDTQQLIYFTDYRPLATEIDAHRVGFLYRLWLSNNELSLWRVW